MRKFFVVMMLVVGLGGCGGPDQPTYQEQPLEFWVQALDQTDRGLRERAIGILLDIRTSDKRLVPMLIQSMQQNGSYSAAEVLGRLAPLGDDTKAVVEALNEALNPKNNISLRREACRSLPKFGSAAQPAVPSLIEILKEEDLNMRALAAETLGQLHEAALPAVEALKQAARDPEPIVSQAAAKALRDIDPAKRAKIP